MLSHTVKLGVAVAVVGAVGVGLLFGGDAFSYVRTSANQVRDHVKDSVPLEFELERARGMIEQILPELHANIKVIAEEEVRIAQLREEIAEAEASVEEQRSGIITLRDMLDSPQSVYMINGRQYDRAELTAELSRRHEMAQTAQFAVATKSQLLQTREQQLDAALDVLQRARARKAQLESKVEALEAQYRLVKAAQVGSPLAVDGGKLAEAERLIRQINERLEVAERVMAHEAKFVERIPLEPAVNEQQVLADVDAFLGKASAQPEATAQSPEKPEPRASGQPVEPTRDVDAIESDRISMRAGQWDSISLLAPQDTGSAPASPKQPRFVVTD